MRALGWIIVFAGLLGATAASGAGFFARAGFPFELFSHFRPHYVAGFSGLAAVAALARFRALAAAGALGAMVNAIAVFAPLAGAVPRASDVEGRSLTLVWSNLQGEHSALKRVAALAAQVDADVVALTELPWFLHGLDDLFPELPCQDRRTTRNPFVVVTLSRAPCGGAGAASPDFWPHAARWANVTGAAQVVAAHPGRPAEINLAALHPIPPLSRRRLADRDAVINAAGETAAARDAALIVGDFNATPWSPVMIDLRRRGFRPVDCGAPWRSTWFSRAPLMGLPIDLAYAGPSVAGARCEVGPDVGSDHYPLIIEAVIAPDAAAPDDRPPED